MKVAACFTRTWNKFPLRYVLRWGVNLPRQKRFRRVSSQAAHCPSRSLPGSSGWLDDAGLGHDLTDPVGSDAFAHVKTVKFAALLLINVPAAAHERCAGRMAEQAGATSVEQAQAQAQDHGGHAQRPGFSTLRALNVFNKCYSMKDYSFPEKDAETHKQLTSRPPLPHPTEVISRRTGPPE